MILGMRADFSMSNRQGEYGSPHIAPMEERITKIDPLASDNDAADSSKASRPGEKESRELGGSPPDGSSKAKSAEAGEGYQNGSSPVHTYPKETINSGDAVSRGSPAARQTDSSILGEPQAPAMLWSNVVSSNVSISPARSSSGETLLTSNTSHLYQPQNQNHTSSNFRHIGAARTRSHSLGAESESSSRFLDMSTSFGNPDATHTGGGGPGVPPSHPGHSAFRDSTLPASAKQGTLVSPMVMYPPSSATYQDFKTGAASTVGSYSSASLGGDSSMMTDQTSPMSSPSLSPHVSPSMHPRRHRDGDGFPPPVAWHLSDSNDCNMEHASGGLQQNHHHHRLHSYPLPQSIPEHHRHDPGDGGYHRVYAVPHARSPAGGPASPPRHLAGSSHYHHHHHPAYRAGRRAGPMSQSTGGSHHRSSTEVLKTLLRKKACLYEPEASLAISLVTWLVGRRLGLSHGCFTRQRLQAGVHAVVSSKIEEGRVTRTKVNRCMQVILNSCFHYVIPRPDGGEEGEGCVFRVEFAREAADEERLLNTLPPPWNDLSLQAMDEEESQGSLFQDSDDETRPSQTKPSGKDTASSQAGDSLDSGGSKRSVLLCFNENVRCAADVFRCHNEFIRDVAHTGGLYLSPQDWRAFFTGTRSGRRRSSSLDGGGAVHHSAYLHLADVHERTDSRGLAEFRTSWCAKRYDHDHAFCAFAHVDINRGWLRRNPLACRYRPVMCPHITPLREAEGCYVNACPHGVDCDHAHSMEEILYHPEVYGRRPCTNPPGTCPLGDICPFSHVDASSPTSHQSHIRRGGRHNHHGDISTHFHRPAGAAHHFGRGRRPPHGTPGNGLTGRDTSILRGSPPGGSPMLYVDPAPPSEFETTLALPGLRALFRDHSASIVHSVMGEGSPYEYGMFGYRKVGVVGTANSQVKAIGT